MTLRDQVAVAFISVQSPQSTGLRRLIMVNLRIVVCLSALLAAGGVQAATNPWFGIWKLKLERPDQRPETLIYSDAGQGAMRMVSVEDKSALVTHFDGQPAADVGAGASYGWSLAVRATSTTSYTWVLAVSDKARAQGINTLTPDGRAFKEVSWKVGEPKKKMTITYVRQ